MAKMKQMYDAKSSQSLPIKFVQGKCIGLFPLFVALVICAIEILVAFIDMIASASAKALGPSKGVLSGSTMQFHLTWGIVMSIALSFIENSLRWQLSRKCCNTFGVLNTIFCALFLISCCYTWIWANDGAGIQLISKYFLSALSVRTSPDQMRILAYSDPIKLTFDLMVSWLFPIQCIIVTVDCVISMCKKPDPQIVDVLFKTDQKGVQCKVDHKKLYQEEDQDKDDD